MEWTLLFAIVTNFFNNKWFVLLSGLIIAGGTYVYFGLYKKQIVKILKQNIFLTLFVIYGCVVALVSFANILQYFDLTRSFEFNMKYIPRHAFYLFLLPIIALVPLLGVSKAVGLIKEHRLTLMLSFYFLNILYFRNSELNAQTFFILGFLSLMCLHEVKAKDWIFMICLVLLPISKDGTSTIIILKIIYIGVFVCYNKLQWKKFVMIFSSFTIPLILIYSLVLPMIPELADKIPDINMRWRLELWREEVTALNETYGLGVGYGTTYVSQEFVDEHTYKMRVIKCPNCNADVIGGGITKGPFGEDDGYTEGERKFVTASHNSFVSIAFRTGFIGLALFCAALVCIWKRLLKHGGENFGAKAFLFCGALFMISFNVGLENPGYLRLFIFAMCAVGANFGEDKTDQADKAISQ